MAFNLQKKNEELFIVGQQTSTTDSGAYSLFTAAHKKKICSWFMCKFTKFTEYHKIWDEEYTNGMSAT